MHETQKTSRTPPNLFSVFELFTQVYVNGKNGEMSKIEFCYTFEINLKFGTDSGRKADDLSNAWAC